MGIPNDPFDPRIIGAAYDAVAEDYDAAFAEDLQRLPVDMAVLEDAVGRCGAGTQVLDLGCGPGQVSAFLAGRGVDVVGVDLAARMVDIAKRRNPTLAFACADMRALPIRSEACGGVVAYYSVQHVRRSELPAVLRGLRRVLAAGGVLVVATHLGEGEEVFDEFLGHRIETAGGTFYGRDELLGALVEAGFELDLVHERGPLEHEHQSQRIYVVATVRRNSRT